MKILNLNKLDKAPARQLTINDVNHPIHPMNVEGFIATTRKVEEIMEKGAGLAEQLESAIDMIIRQVPTLTRADLIKYTPEVLNSIVEFVRGGDVEGAEEAAQDEAGK